MYGPPFPPPPPRNGVPGAAVILIAFACLYVGGVGGCTLGVIAASTPQQTTKTAAPPTVAGSSPTSPSIEPTVGAPAEPSPSPSKTATKRPRKKATPTRTAAAPANDPRFRTCAEANDAGYGPYFKGQDPEYDWYIDRDDDGIVCEP